MRRPSCQLRRWTPALSAEPVPSAVRRRRPPCSVPYARTLALFPIHSPRTPPLPPPKLFGSLSRRCHARLSPAIRLDADAAALVPAPYSSRTDRPDAEGSAPATRAIFHAPALGPLHRVCCTQFELNVRPRLDRASNDASICPRRSPTPTRRGPPRTPSSGVATGHPTIRAVLLCHYVSILLPRHDLMANAASLAVHGVCDPLCTNAIPAVPFALRQVVTTAVRIEALQLVSKAQILGEYAAPAAFVKPKLCADTLQRLQYYQLSAARSKSTFAVLYLNWVDFFGCISFTIEDFQILRIQFESIVFLLGPELGNLKYIRTDWGTRQYNEEGHRELSRVKRYEQRELNWNWGEDEWMWDRIGVGFLGETILRVNTENNNRVSPAKETSRKNSEQKSNT
ncbi:hypothetical protein B0H13DRAFT_1868317 [Mycena leptocephala]|nr:hypothetical protein B0H13DRAFT_1868317 [Mycena leptocephala]